MTGPSRVLCESAERGAKCTAWSVQEVSRCAFHSDRAFRGRVLEGAALKLFTQPHGEREIQVEGFLDSIRSDPETKIFGEWVAGKIVELKCVIAP